MEMKRLTAETMIEAVQDELVSERVRATSNHAPMNSAHEGFAILLEEVDELKAEVWKKESRRDYDAMKTEALHVATVAIRLIYDVINPELMSR
jgi:hypothetical protein